MSIELNTVTVPYVYRRFPTYLYRHGGASVLVQTETEWADRQAEGWMTAAEVDAPPTPAERAPVAVAGETSPVVQASGPTVPVKAPAKRKPGRPRKG